MAEATVVKDPILVISEVVTEEEADSPAEIMEEIAPTSPNAVLSFTVARWLEATNHFNFNFSALSKNLSREPFFGLENC